MSSSVTLETTVKLAAAAVGAMIVVGMAKRASEPSPPEDLDPNLAAAPGLVCDNVKGWEGVELSAVVVKAWVPYSSVVGIYQV